MITFLKKKQQRSLWAVFKATSSLFSKNIVDI